MHWLIYIYIYSSVYIISAIDDFLINGIQALHHQFKKNVDCKGTILKNKPHVITFHESILDSL